MEAAKQIRKANYSLSSDLKEIYDLQHQLEDSFEVDTDTGEIINTELTEETEEKFQNALQKISRQVDNLGVFKIDVESQIVALTAIKQSYETIIRRKKRVFEKFINYLAYPVRKIGEVNKSGYKILRGEVATLKDISGWAFEFDIDKPKKDQQWKIEDYPNRYRTIKIELPEEVYTKIFNEIQKEILSSEPSVNKPLLARDYNEQFVAANKLGRIENETDLLADKKKSAIAFPDMVGVRKVWRNKVSFLGLKKIGGGEE